MPNPHGFQFKALSAFSKRKDVKKSQPNAKPLTRAGSYVMKTKCHEYLTSNFNDFFSS